MSTAVESLSECRRLPETPRRRLQASIRLYPSSASHPANVVSVGVDPPICAPPGSGSQAIHLIRQKVSSRRTRSSPPSTRRSSRRGFGPCRSRPRPLRISRRHRSKPRIHWTHQLLFLETRGFSDCRIRIKGAHFLATVPLSSQLRLISIRHQFAAQVMSMASPDGISTNGRRRLIGERQTVHTSAISTSAIRRFASGTNGSHHFTICSYPPWARRLPGQFGEMVSPVRNVSMRRGG